MKKTIIILFLLTSFLVKAQDTKNTWQIGVGVSVVKFSDENASFIGDRYLFQIPRLNLTMPINERFSVDGALSFNTIDNFSLVQNSARYISADFSLRYNIDQLFDNFYPYVFAGGSLVKSNLKMTPTLNIGAGSTYWFLENWGANGQLYYKYSFEGYESMRSHLQGTLGIVYNLGDSLFGGRGSSGKPCF
ncbi:hypothetical protein [Tenacibaculum aquimarinum]|uniref:hypothetical protein n=1 Tax=Tenacibaculum aquimarinum TaxID=2910675 RepID=UPI001F0B1CC0|nr:hypothetical protein [Tenacibaculum aquimarinum]MCH3883780.1 hypothetical protein [Tenacibaculum aquimarinum]